MTQKDFRHFLRNVCLSGCATPATQNDSRPSFETFELKGFAASPIGTVTPQENQRIERRHVGASSVSCETSFKFSHFVATKSTFSYESSCNPQNLQPHTISKPMLHAKRPSIFITCHKMPHLPQNSQVVTTRRSPHNAIHEDTQHYCASESDVKKKMRLSHRTTFDT